MNAKIYTKSNYRNLNGTILNVLEIVKNRVTCKVWHEECDAFITTDFTKSEVVLLR